MTLLRIALAAPVLALAVQAGAQQPWNVVDQNDDGVATYEEAAAAYDDLAEASFRDADIDGNGVLTEEELPALNGIYNALDDDG